MIMTRRTPQSQDDSRARDWVFRPHPRRVNPPTSSIAINNRDFDFSEFITRPTNVIANHLLARPSKTWLLLHPCRRSRRNKKLILIASFKNWFNFMPDEGEHIDGHGGRCAPICAALASRWPSPSWRRRILMCEDGLGPTLISHLESGVEPSTYSDSFSTSSATAVTM